MPSKIFEFCEDEEFGGWGWKPVNFPGANTAEAMGIVHDILEHFPRDRMLSEIEDELLALGASLHVRGEGYYASKTTGDARPAFQMAPELANILDRALFGDEKLRRFRPQRHRNEDLKEQIQCCVDLAFKSFFNRNSALTGEIPVRITEAIEDQFGSQAEMRARMAYWLLRGARQAKTRYRHRWGACMANAELSCFFSSAEATLEKRLKDMGDYGRIRITLRPKTHTIKVTPVSDPYDDY